MDLLDIGELKCLTHYSQELREGLNWHSSRVRNLTRIIKDLSSPKNSRADFFLVGQDRLLFLGSLPEGSSLSARNDAYNETVRLLGKIESDARNFSYQMAKLKSLISRFSHQLPWKIGMWERSVEGFISDYGHGMKESVGTLKEIAGKRLTTQAAGTGVYFSNYALHSLSNAAETLEKTEKGLKKIILFRQVGIGLGGTLLLAVAGLLIYRSR